MPRFCSLIMILALAFWSAGCPGEDIETGSACVQLEPGAGRIFIRDYQFERYRFFDLGRTAGVNYLTTGDVIQEFFLYQSVASTNIDNSHNAFVFDDIQRPTLTPDSVEQRFQLLDFSFDYELISDSVNGRYFIFFPSRLQNIQNTAIAYYMVVRKADGSTLTFGDRAPGIETYWRLQLLKRTNSSPSDATWDAEWKNVYDLRVRNINYNDLDLDIFRGDVRDEANRANLNYQSSGKRYYLQILKLDQLDATGAFRPDYKVDDNPEVLDTFRGLLIFPDRYPFASDALEESVPGLYTTVPQSALLDSSKYYFKMLHAVDLGFRDIVDGSVRVSADGAHVDDLHLLSPMSSSLGPCASLADWETVVPRLSSTPPSSI